MSDQPSLAPQAPQSRPPMNLPIASSRAPSPSTPVAAPTQAPKPALQPPAPAMTEIRAPAPTPTPPPRITSEPRPMPVAPTPHASVTEQVHTMSTDIARITTGTYTAPTDRTPQAPLPARITPPPVQEPSTSRGRMAAYAISAIMVIGLIGYLISSILSNSDSIATTPTPVTSRSASPSPTSTPSNARKIASYFGDTTTLAALPQSSSIVTDARNTIIATKTQPKAAQRLLITIAGATPTSSVAVRSLLTPSLPETTLASFLGADWATVTYGQTEQYTSAGALTTGTATRPVMIIEVTDATIARQQMLSWETSGLLDAASRLFGFDATKRKLDTFSDALHRTLPVRFINFPYADSSIDYAIVTASNNVNYLVIASSRESLFYVVDLLTK